MASETRFVTQAIMFMNPSTTFLSNQAIGVDIRLKMMLLVMKIYNSSM
jgi:hypothetical protein